MFPDPGVGALVLTVLLLPNHNASLVAEMAFFVNAVVAICVLLSVTAGVGARG